MYMNTRIFLKAAINGTEDIRYEAAFGYLQKGLIGEVQRVDEIRARPYLLDRINVISLFFASELMKAGLKFTEAREVLSTFQVRADRCAAGKFEGGLNALLDHSVVVRRRQLRDVRTTIDLTWCKGNGGVGETAAEGALSIVISLVQLTAKADALILAHGIPSIKSDPDAEGLIRDALARKEKNDALLIKRAEKVAREDKKEAIATATVVLKQEPVVREESHLVTPDPTAAPAPTAEELAALSGEPVPVSSVNVKVSAASAEELKLEG